MRLFLPSWELNTCLFLVAMNFFQRCTQRNIKSLALHSVKACSLDITTWTLPAELCNITHLSWKGYFTNGDIEFLRSVLRKNCQHLLGLELERSARAHFGKIIMFGDINRASSQIPQLTHRQRTLRLVEGERVALDRIFRQDARAESSQPCSILLPCLESLSLTGIAFDERASMLISALTMENVRELRLHMCFEEEKFLKSITQIGVPTVVKTFEFVGDRKDRHQYLPDFIGKLEGVQHLYLGKNVYMSSDMFALWQSLTQHAGSLKSILCDVPGARIPDSWWGKSLGLMGHQMKVLGIRRVWNPFRQTPLRTFSKG